MTTPTTPAARGPLDPAVTLATAAHSQPGVYALLLGSGVSTGAGIPTGWGITTDLVRRVAAIDNLEEPEAGEAAATDPEAWWALTHDEPLGYSSLLEELAPTQAARQGLLAGYFEPTQEDPDDDNKRPSAAHRAIADLVKRGTIRVIVTTNFDRLMEQALADAGVSPQVISRPEAVQGMAPLAHAPATVIKLHGDYKDLETLNTASELTTYPQQWVKLMEQVVDEYGLVIAGWSADWDIALANVIENAPSRRYPLYWDSRSSKGDTAQRLLANRAGHTITAGSADELFTDLAARVDALDRLAQPPLSTAMAVARLKRYLPDPVRRIELHDLVMDATERAVSSVAGLQVNGPADGQFIQDMLAQALEGSTPLLKLLATGVWHDDEAAHEQLWVDVLQRLVDAGTTRLQSATTVLEPMRRYPALLAMTTMGMASILRRREHLLIRLGVEVKGPPDMGIGEPLSAADLLHYERVLHHDGVLAQPRWKSRFHYPGSHQIKADLGAALEDFIPRPRFEGALHGVEYRVSLLQNSLVGGGYAQPGEYVGEREWARDEEGELVPRSELAFRQAPDLAPWHTTLEVYDHEDAMLDFLIDHRQHLKAHQRRG